MATEESAAYTDEDVLLALMAWLRRSGLHWLLREVALEAIADLTSPPPGLPKLREPTRRNPSEFARRNRDGWTEHWAVAYLDRASAIAMLWALAHRQDIENGPSRPRSPGRIVGDNHGGTAEGQRGPMDPRPD